MELIFETKYSAKSSGERLELEERGEVERDEKRLNRAMFFDFAHSTSAVLWLRRAAYNNLKYSQDLLR